MKTQYILKENNAGGLLLTVTECDEVLMLNTWQPEEMSEYLDAARNGMNIDTLRSMATFSAEVEEAEIPIYMTEWENERTIADTNGIYRDRAGVAGEKTLQLCGLREDALTELERCETAEEVRDLVVTYPEAATANIDNEQQRHEFAWRVCKLVFVKTLPENFEELQHVAQLWDDICRELIFSVAISLTPYYSNKVDFQPVSFEEANIIELSCERVDLRGFRPYEFASELARLCEGEFLKWVESDQDGDFRWFYFEKK